MGTHNNCERFKWRIMENGKGKVVSQTPCMHWRPQKTEGIVKEDGDEHL